jgi:DNA integrity scanning protein DisA with diadenylate cyclase activity
MTQSESISFLVERYRFLSNIRAVTLVFQFLSFSVVPSLAYIFGSDDLVGYIFWGLVHAVISVSVITSARSISFEMSFIERAVLSAGNDRYADVFISIRNQSSYSASKFYKIPYLHIYITTISGVMLITIAAFLNVYGLLI